MRRKWVWVGLVVVVLACLGLTLAGRAGRARLQAAQTAQTGETVTVVRGDLASTASAGGQIVAQREASLALARAGRVETVAVTVGDVVTAGQTLLTVEAGALQRAVTNASENLAIQEANLAGLQAEPAAADVAAAEAAVESAEAQLATVRNGPSEEEIAAAEANVRAAQANVTAASFRVQETQAPADEAALLQAQENVTAAEDAVQQAERNHQRTVSCEQEADGSWTCTPRFDEEITHQAELVVVQARENLAAAQAELDQLQAGADANSVSAAQANVASQAAQLDAAQANLDLLLAGPTPADEAAAEASLADAQANLARLLAGPSAAAVAVAQAQVAQARLAWERARRSVEDATLVAPFAGVVTAVYVTAGEVASGVAVDLVAMDSLEVVLDVDEVDMGELAVGQPAQVTLAAWPDEKLDAEIVAIAPAATSLALDNSIASFRVHLALAPTDLPLRTGMTADARLQTAARQDVLLVPNRAITADREAGKYYVNLVERGADGTETARPVEVTIGLRDEQVTEIRDGLVAGDKVRVGPLPAPDSPFGAGPPEDGGPRGGGMFGGG